MNLNHTRGPLIKTTQESFTESMRVAGEVQRVAFEKAIDWYQETETTLHLVHGGVVVKECSTYNDFYGYLTSPTGALEAAEALAKLYTITAESTLILEAVCSIYLRPGFETDESRKESARAPYTRAYNVIPREWCWASGADTPGIFKSLQDELIIESVVWTSKFTQEQNNAALLEFKSRWAVAKE